MRLGSAADADSMRDSEGGAAVKIRSPRARKRRRRRRNNIVELGMDVSSLQQRFRQRW